MTPFANKYGLYDFIKRVNEGLMAVNLLALLVGFESHMLWGLLVVIQMVLFASWGFYDLIMADVIDGDRVKNKRKESVSTSVHGVQALIVKPSQSLAPMLGFMGTVIGMIETFQAITLFGTGDPKTMANGISEALVTTMLGLMTAIPATFMAAIMANYAKNILTVLEEQSTGMVAAASEENKA
mgnify:CR=1 FL=1